jgi:hypothetical protein
MKASQVGSNTITANRVLDHFGYLYNWRTYIATKYDGLIPENFPTKEDFRRINEQMSYHRKNGDPDGVVPLLVRQKQQLEKQVKAVQREWMRQQ